MKNVSNAENLINRLVRTEGRLSAPFNSLPHYSLQKSRRQAVKIAAKNA